MASPYPKQLPMDFGIANSLSRMRRLIVGNWRSVDGSRRTIVEAEEAIARANEVLAWRMSDGRNG